MSKRKAKKARRIEAAAERAKRPTPESFRLRNANVSAGVASRYSSERYTPFYIEQMSNREISSELSKARSILRKRYERAVSAGAWTKRQVERVEQLLTPVKDVPVSDRPEQLSLIARELSSSTSTIAGARSRLEEVINQFHSHGYYFVNMGNIEKWLEFLNEFTAEEIAAIYGSDELAEYYEKWETRQKEGDKVKISRRSFLQWDAKLTGRPAGRRSKRKKRKRR